MDYEIYFKTASKHSSESEYQLKRSVQ